MPQNELAQQADAALKMLDEVEKGIKPTAASQSLAIIEQAETEKALGKRVRKTKKENRDIFEGTFNFVNENIISDTDRAAFNALRGNPGALGDIAGSTIGDVGGTLGGAALGGLVGNVPGAIVGGILGAAGGSALGLKLSRMAQGKTVTPAELFLEGSLSALPGAGAEALKGLGKAGVKLGGKAKFAAKPVREFEGRAASELRKFADESAFNPIKKKAIELFDLVRASGDLIEPRALTEPLKDLGDEEFRLLSRRIKNIGAPIGQRIPDFGPDLAKTLNAIREGQDVSGLDIGALQHIRSELSLASFSKSGSTEGNGIDFFIDSLDNAIENGRFLKGGESSLQVREARKLYREAKEIEEVANFLREVTPANKAGELTVHFGRLEEGIKFPSTRTARLAGKALDRNPAQKKEILEFAKNIKPFVIKQDPGGRLGQSSITGQVLSGVAGLLSNAQSRKEFNRIILGNASSSPTGQRFITLNQVRFLVNASRRGVLPPGEPVFPGNQNIPQGR